MRIAVLVVFMVAGLAPAAHAERDYGGTPIAM